MILQNAWQRLTLILSQKNKTIIITKEWKSLDRRLAKQRKKQIGWVCSNPVFLYPTPGAELQKLMQKKKNNETRGPRKLVH